MLTPETTWDQVIATRQYNLESPDHLVVGALDRLKREKVESVIDIGCGLGRHLVVLAEAGFSVLGVDIAPSAVAASAERVREYRDAKVMQSDATSIDVPAASFDFALAWRMVHLSDMSQVAAILSEISRILKPHARFFCSVRSLSNSLYPKAKAKGEEIEKNTFRMGSDGLNGLTYHFFSRDEVVSSFAPYFEFEAIEEVELQHTPYTSEADEYSNWFWIISCRKKRQPLEED